MISIHALREEGDCKAFSTLRGFTPFLSTPSARRATRSGPCKAHHGDISIHALREEGDIFSHVVCPFCTAYFYPRPPRGGRLQKPLQGGTSWNYFYPRPPRGGRPAVHGGKHRDRRFLSTPSARRATLYGDISERSWWISIHALREEGDAAHAETDGQIHNFYPRPPRGGRQATACRSTVFSVFLSTPSARRATV